MWYVIVFFPADNSRFGHFQFPPEDNSPKRRLAMEIVVDNAFTFFAFLLRLF